MAYPKGEPRPEGAGRKAGNAPRQRASADVVKAWRDADKPTPLLVMLEAMMEELLNDENIKNKRQHRRAFPYAAAAAPYFHAKPQASLGFTLDNPDEVAREIAQALGEIEQRTAPPKPSK